MTNSSKDIPAANTAQGRQFRQEALDLVDKERDEARAERAYGELLDRLASAGWGFMGADFGQTISVAFGLHPEVRRLTTEEAQPYLDITDQEGKVRDGFKLLEDPATGQVGVEYDGPFDETFVRVAEAMIEVGNGTEATPAAVRRRLGADDWLGKGQASPL